MCKCIISTFGCNNCFALKFIDCKSSLYYIIIWMVKPHKQTNPDILYKKCLSGKWAKCHWLLLLFHPPKEGNFFHIIHLKGFHSHVNRSRLKSEQNGVLKSCNFLLLSYFLSFSIWDHSGRDLLLIQLFFLPAAGQCLLRGVVIFGINFQNRGLCDHYTTVKSRFNEWPPLAHFDSKINANAKKFQLLTQQQKNKRNIHGTKNHNAAGDLTLSQQEQQQQFSSIVDLCCCCR